MEEFGLFYVVKFCVGNDNFWGFFGGERCCVFIGVDVIYDFVVLIFDEFMFGLDSGFVLYVVLMLSRMVIFYNCIIIFSIY